MLTVDIGQNEMKIMEITGKKVVKWGNCSLESSLFEDGVISVPDAIGNLLKQLMLSTGINGSSVTASINGLYSLSRIILVPNPPGGPTRQMVLESAQEVMPLSEEESYISWQTVDIIEGGQQVLILGVPRDVVDNQMQALKMAGLSPQVLDLKAMALVRAVNRADALILNIDTDAFDLIVVTNGVTGAMHTTAWQPENLTDDSLSEQLAGALELAVDFHQSQRNSLSLPLNSPLIITGQMSGNSGLIDKLQSRIAFAMEPFIPPVDYPDYLPISEYAVNIGLALKGSAAPKWEQGENAHSLPDMNLLPEIYKPWKPSARQLQSVVAAIVTIILLFPFYQITANSVRETDNLKAEYTQIQTELERRQVEIKNREPLQKAVGEYNTIVNLGGGFTDNLQVINDLAEELKIEVKSVTHNENKITLECQADDYLTFRSFLDALTETGRFSSIDRPPEQYGYVNSGILTITPNTGS